MFRAMFSFIIRSTWLYLQYLVVFTQVAASRQQLGWTLPDTVNTVKCYWWWAKTSPETCRATWNNKLIYIVHLVGYFHSCLIRNCLSLEQSLLGYSLYLSSSMNKLFNDALSVIQHEDIRRTITDRSERGVDYLKVPPYHSQRRIVEFLHNIRITWR